MKNRFTTIDVMAAIHDLKSLEGMRVANIYDMNSKTYLIKLQKPEEKAVILFESGIRIHRTYHDWPKSQFPSSFSMKMRKHVKQKRFESINQLGVDRVIDMRFGDDDRAVHIIVELYDRGNILLTDHDYVILNILRPRTDKDTDVKLSVKQRYPIENARQSDTIPIRNDIEKALGSAKKGDNLRRLLAPLVQFGGPLIDHVLLEQGFPQNAQMLVSVENDKETLDKLETAVGVGATVYNQIRSTPCKGYVTYKEDQRPGGEKIQTYTDYHPFLFAQCSKGLHHEFPSFSESVDDFYSKMDEQKQDQRALNMERDALKKLDNVKKDQDVRLQVLADCQDKQKLIAERVIMNKDLVERALLVLRSAVANQLTWDAIEEMRDKAVKAGDATAKSIVRLKLDSNQFVMRLADPYDEDEPSIEAEIDLGLNAFQNSRRYFEDKKAAADKVQKTLASAGKAIKNAQLKTKETLEKLEQVRIRATKKRKPMWFEKFLWFISSENYVVVAGRDAQQNEMIVKRYLRDGDVYMHADIRGAASIVIRNKAGRGPIPPKTLTEAAQMAVCYSNAWEAKVVASAWWVYHHQVSRTAPSGEYLTPGSFMIRGKKNYMPASPLVMGFGMLFRVDEESAERHKGERKVITENLDQSEVVVEEEVDEVLDESDDEADKNEDQAENEQEEEFPDVEVNIKGLRASADDEFTILEIGQKSQMLKHKKQHQTKEQETQMYLEEKREQEKKALLEQKGLTMRQKHKQAKMKKKYGDQDDEERELRMQLLGSRGKPKPSPPQETVVKATNETKHSDSKAKNVQDNRKVEFSKEPQTEEIHKVVKEENPVEEEDDEKDEEDKAVDDSEAITELLTGIPYDEDGLLFAVPMVAPYQVLNNFKYKVKLTPGTGKRGKAAKSALELFLRMKPSVPQQEGLIRLLVGDEATARNIPGKVKVSAPMLHKK